MYDVDNNNNTFVLHYDTAPFTAAALIGESAILHDGHWGTV